MVYSFLQKEGESPLEKAFFKCFKAAKKKEKASLECERIFFGVRKNIS